MVDASTLCRFPRQTVQIFGYVYHDTNDPTLGPTLKTQLFLFNENLCGHPIAGLLWERQFEKVLLGPGWESTELGNSYFVHRKQGLSFSEYVDDSKNGGRI